MQFDPSNQINKLCSEGMFADANGEGGEALRLFLKAWSEAQNDFEKFISAHYLARGQKNIEDKLEWDRTALLYASKINDENVKACYPSLYLNIAKGYEDLNNFENARKNYLLADSYTDFMEEDGYASMIKRGISNGLERIKNQIM